MAKNMFEKIWEAHEVDDDLIYIDLHLVHEVTSPQAFDGLRLAGRGPPPRPARWPRPITTSRPTARRPRGDRGRALAQADRGAGENCAEFGVPLYCWARTDAGHRPRDRPGAGPDPAGMTIVCGDCHTSTHGAFGALAFGIGTSRGRARAGHPVPGPAQAEDDAHQLRRRAGLRRHRQGPDPRRRSARSASAAAGIRRRIRRRADRGALDGRPHDDLQHDRSRPAAAPAWSRPTRPPSTTSKGRPGAPGRLDAAVERWR